MNAILLDGKKISEKIEKELKEKVLKIKKPLTLAIVLVGENQASKKYIEQKKKFGKEIKVGVEIFKFPKTISTQKLRREVGKISKKTRISGLIVQLPLPKNINTQYVLNAVSAKKDVDALTRELSGRIYLGSSPILPPTTAGILKLSDGYKIEVKGKSVVIIGFGKLVGQPTSIVLAQRGATITVINEFTQNKEEFIKLADIVISGVGKPNIVTKKMLKDGVVVVDAGYSTVPGKAGTVQFIGDVNKDAESVASYITPVPGGVGPMTVAMLFSNLIELSK